MRYKVTCAYDGTNYAGFQSQKNALAIQDVLEMALKKLYKQDIRIIIASRTDAGVHAYGQVFVYDNEKQLSLYNIKTGLNTFLPNDIHINEIEVVRDDFHPRYHEKEKTYEYLINLGEFDPLLINRAYQSTYILDLEKMKKCAELFIGTYDFGSFNTSSYEEYPNQVRTIRVFKLKVKKDLLTITVTGNGFLRNQIRIMVGTLIEVGRGKKTIKDVKDMLKHPNKTTKRYNITPSGLYLKSIKY